MRQRTKIPIPEPGKSEFKNFDRLVGILLTKPKPTAKKKEPKGVAKIQEPERERLPLP